MPDLIQSLPLSGPPSFTAGATTLIMPNPTRESGLDPQWVNEHRTLRTLSGDTLIVQRRYRGKFRLGWRALSRTAFEALLDVLEEATFTFTPRTALGAEPTTEVAPDGSITNLLQQYVVRCISPLNVTRPLRLDTYDIDIELETTGVIGDALPDPIGGTAGGNGETAPPQAGTTTESGVGGITLDCPDSVVFVTSDLSAPGGDFLDGADVNLGTVKDADGVSRFTKTITEPRGYIFDVASITITTGSPSGEATPAEAFNWTVCPMECVLQDASSPTLGGETAQRLIYFEVLYDVIAAGTYLVTILLNYDCTSFNLELTFNMTK